MAFSTGRLILCAAAIAACGPSPVATPPQEVVTIEASYVEELGLTCGDGWQFHAAQLDAAIGAEGRPGEAFSLLQAALVRFRDEFPDAIARPWRMVREDSQVILFIGEPADGDDDWLAVAVPAGEPSTIQRCALQMSVGDSAYVGTWELDGVSAPSQLDVVPVLFRDPTCSGGATAGLGRATVSRLPDGTAALAIGAEERPGNWFCEGRPPVKLAIRLPAGLAGATLVDGGAGIDPGR